MPDYCSVCGSTLNQTIVRVTDGTGGWRHVQGGCPTLPTAEVPPTQESLLSSIDRRLEAIILLLGEINARLQDDG